MSANDDFGDFYANCIMNYTSEEERNVWFPRSYYHVTHVELK